MTRKIFRCETKKRGRGRRSNLPIHPDGDEKFPHSMRCWDVPHVLTELPIIYKNKSSFFLSEKYFIRLLNDAAELHKPRSGESYLRDTAHGRYLSDKLYSLLPLIPNLI